MDPISLNTNVADPSFSTEKVASLKKKMIFTTMQPVKE